MIDKEVRKDNKIPGCDRMTRPEEISALSKFLGHVREVQDKHTHLSHGLDGLPFKNDGRNMPEIEELDDRLYVINPEAKEHDKKIELIHDPHLRPEGIPGADPDLTTKYRIPEGEPKEDLKPVDIEGRWKIPGESSGISLVLGEDGVLRIPTSPLISEPKPEERKEKIPGEIIEPSSLRASISNLPETMGEKVEGLEKEKEQIPGTSLTVQKLATLKDKVPGIKPEINTLEEEVATIPGDQEELKTLPSTSSPVPGTLEPPTKLPTDRSSIPASTTTNNERLELEEERETIPGNILDSNLTLPSESSPIPDSHGRSEITNLEEDVVRIEGWKESVKSLRADVVEVVENKNPDYIGKEWKGSLEEEVPKVPDSQGADIPNSLPDTFSKLPGTLNDPSTLPGAIEVIPENTGGDVESLPEDVEKIPDGEDDLIYELPDNFDQLLEGQPDIEGLYDTALARPDGIEKEISELPDDFEKILEGNSQEISQLPNSTYTLPEDSTEKDLALSTFQESRPKGGEELKDLPDSYERRPKGIEEELKNLPDSAYTLPDDTSEKDLVLSTLQEELPKGTEEELRDLPDDYARLPEGGEELKDLPDSYERRPKGIEEELKNLPDSAYTLPEDSTKKNLALSILREGRPKGEETDLKDLPDSKEGIPNSEGLDEVVKELSDYIEVRPEREDDTTPQSLSDFKATRPGEEKDITNLPTSDELLPEGDSEIKDLSDYIEERPEEEPEIESLSDYLEKRPEEDPEIEGLSNQVKERPEEDPEIKELSDYKEQRPEEDPEIEGLYDTSLQRPDCDPSSKGEPEKLHNTALKRPGKDKEIKELPDTLPPEILPQKEEEVDEEEGEFELWSKTEIRPTNDPDNVLPKDKKSIDALEEAIEEYVILGTEEKVEELDEDIQKYVKRGDGEHKEVEDLWNGSEGLEIEGHVEEPVEDLNPELKIEFAGKEKKDELEDGKIDMPEGLYEKEIAALEKALEKENLNNLQLFKEFLAKVKKLWEKRVIRPEGKVEKEADPTEVYRETLFPTANKDWFPNDYSETLGELKSNPQLYDALVQIIANFNKDWFPNHNFTDEEPTLQELYLACLQLLENNHPEITELSSLKEKLFNWAKINDLEVLEEKRMDVTYRELESDNDNRMVTENQAEIKEIEELDTQKKGETRIEVPEVNYSEIIEKFKSGDFKENHKLLLDVLKNEHSEWSDKIMSQLSTIAGSEADKQNPKALEHYQHFLYKEGELLGLYDSSDHKIQNLDYPKYKLPHFTLDSINPNNYLRWVAEEMIGTSIKGQARQILLDETLALLCLARNLLEDTAGTSRNRLPGDSGLLQDTLGGFMQDGVKGVIQSFGNGLKSAISHDNSAPKNRPNKKGVTTGWENVNNIDSIGEYGGGGDSATQNKSLLGQIVQGAKDALLGNRRIEDYNFSKHYLQGAGIGITLEELCNNTSVETISSVEDLFQAIKNSPFMASSEKVTSGPNRYVVSTLDSNAFWEITLEPYLGKSNGYMSYLPALNEMNTRNSKVHGVNTQYNRYIPAVSFDLQKSKMTTKTLGLYDGEISYPVSMELMNEFRITLIDDQYKSWKNYFETAAEVSVYSSIPHWSDYYDKGGRGNVTMADQQHVIVSNYKNVTWRCKIYCMTPQLSTTRRYDLLLVIKDMVEEYSGELDGAAQDLTVTFSIVGENPGDAEEIQVRTEIIPGNPREEKSEDLVESLMESVIDKGISSVLKLI